MSNTKKVQESTNANNRILVVKPAITVKKEEQPLKAVKAESKEVKSIVENFAPTAEERIKNAENFKILTNKFEHLKQKSEELKRFKISSDGTKEKIYLENSEGFKFVVSNSKIVDETLNLLESTLNGILKNTEKEVQNFII